jgi:hypothetical protein
MVKLILLIIPLGLDTFAASVALGLRGLPRRERLRISLILSSFETAMPVVGLFIGHGLGSAIGTAADYIAIAILAAVGIWMLVANEEVEEEQIAQLSSGRGLAILALGLSISLDELAAAINLARCRADRRPSISRRPDRYAVRDAWRRSTPRRSGTCCWSRASRRQSHPACGAARAVVPNPSRCFLSRAPRASVRFAPMSRRRSPLAWDSCRSCCSGS